LFLASRTRRIVRMQIVPLDPLRDETIVLMPDKNFRRLTVPTVPFGKLYGGAQRLRFGWESRCHTAMRISNLPTTLVDHDVSRFMQSFLRLSLQTLNGNAQVRHRFDHLEAA
jgi:hypothetical protein